MIGADYNQTTQEIRIVGVILVLALLAFIATATAIVVRLS